MRNALATALRLLANKLGGESDLAVAALYLVCNLTPGNHGMFLPDGRKVEPWGHVLVYWNGSRFDQGCGNGMGLYQPIEWPITIPLPRTRPGKRETVALRAVCFGVRGRLHRFRLGNEARNVELFS